MYTINKSVSPWAQIRTLWVTTPHDRLHPYFCSFSCFYPLTIIINWQGAPQWPRDHSGYSPMVWAAVCGNVVAMEKLLNANDGGTPSSEKGEKITHVQQEKVDLQHFSSKDQKKGAAEPTQGSEGVNDRGTPSDKQEKKGGVADIQNQEVVNNGGTPSSEKQEKILNLGEEVIPEGGDLGGSTTTDKEQAKGDTCIEKEEVLQPLHAAASVGSEKVCTTLINAGARVCIVPVRYSYQGLRKKH